jgi:hypothetical protein
MYINPTPCSHSEAQHNTHHSHNTQSFVVTVECFVECFLGKRVKTLEVEPRFKLKKGNFCSLIVNL